jgi:hypothetical protein
MLYLLRAVHERDKWSGHVAFPGGKLEPQDENIRATAMRETLEEVGIDLKSPAYKYLGRLNDLNIGFGVKMVVCPFGMRLHLNNSQSSLFTNYTTRRTVQNIRIRSTISSIYLNRVAIATISDIVKVWSTYTRKRRKRCTWERFNNANEQVHTNL